MNKSYRIFILFDKINILLILIFNYPINLKSLNYERICEFTDQLGIYNSI